MILRSLVLSFIIYSSLPGTVFPDGVKQVDVISQIALANDHYANNQFQEAAEIYQTLIDGGHKNGYLYYNLGNAYLRIGKWGPAILNYIRAKNFLPRDQSLDANLRTAILKTEDQLEPPSKRGLNTLFFWLNNFTRSELLFYVVITNLGFWLVLGIWFVNRTGFWNLAGKTMLAFLIISILSVGVKIGYETETTTGVVLANEIDVKSDRSRESMILFQLHAGSVVAIVERQNDLYQIKLNDGKKGWVQKDFIGL